MSYEASRFSSAGGAVTVTVFAFGPRSLVCLRCLRHFLVWHLLVWCVRRVSRRFAAFYGCGIYLFGVFSAFCGVLLALSMWHLPIRLFASGFYPGNPDCAREIRIPMDQAKKTKGLSKRNPD